MEVKCVTGMVGIGDKVVYPSSRGLVTGRVTMITVRSVDGYNGTVTQTRIQVMRLNSPHDRWTCWSPVSIRNPMNIAVTEKAVRD